MAESDYASTIIVEARDLDTDERSESRATVERPRAPAAQREQLQAVVERLHPAARIRSYEAGVASFLGPQHLVVARYDGKPRPTTAAGPAVEQPPLFA